MSENNEKLSAAVEAVLFASGAPVATDKLCELLSIAPQELSDILASLNEKYQAADSGISLIQVENACQLCTKSEYSQYVKQALELRRLPPLSRAALEVLAIIAYNQPVTRSFIEQVRGTDSASIVSSLTDKGLIREKGFLNAPGRPILFGTTDNFLRCFGLTSIDELPEAGELPQADGQETMDELFSGLSDASAATDD